MKAKNTGPIATFARVRSASSGGSLHLAQGPFAKTAARSARGWRVAALQEAM